MRRCLSLTFLAASAVAAQATIPHTLTSQWGEQASILPWGKTASRWQQVADRSALPASLVAGRQITHLGVRRLAQDAVLAAVSLDTEMALYDVNLSAAGMGTSFAANRAGGQGGVAFARRIVNLPPLPLLNPDTSVHLLPLDAPRPFAGPNLLVEIVNHGGGSTFTGWYADAALSYGPDGIPADLGGKCGNLLNMMLSSGPYRPGATFRVTEFYTAFSAVPVNALGFSATASQFGTLPLDLTALGAIDCVVRVSLDILVPGSGSPGYNVDYPVPAHHTFSGVKLYSQWLNYDPGANPLGVTVSAARVISLGTRSYAIGHTERENDDQDTFGTGPHRGGGAVLVLRHN